MTELLKHEIEVRIIEEGIARIKQCLFLLNEQHIESKPNAYLNSVSNLVRHLNGNVRQWILSGLLGFSDNRNRDTEFLDTQHTKEELLSLLNELEQDLMNNLPSITQEMLMKDYTIQGIPSSGVAVVVHVIEHFSYHVGQIAWLTKYYTNQDLGFYADNSNLNNSKTDN